VKPGRPARHYTECVQLSLSPDASARRYPAHALPEPGHEFFIPCKLPAELHRSRIGTGEWLLRAVAHSGGSGQTSHGGAYIGLSAKPLAVFPRSRERNNLPTVHLAVVVFLETHRSFVPRARQIGGGLILPAVRCRFWEAHCALQFVCAILARERAFYSSVLESERSELCPRTFSTFSVSNLVAAVSLFGVEFAGPCHEGGCAARWWCRSHSPQYR